MATEDVIHIIANPHAGGGNSKVASHLRQRGFRVRVNESTGIDHARDLASQAVRENEIVTSLGGDGLAGALADVVWRENGRLAILPAGRGNDLARKLGIPNDPIAACSVFRDPQIREIDVATVGDRSFLGICSVGIDSDVVAFANSSKLPLGGGIYAYGLLRALKGWQHIDWKVTVDGTVHEFSGYSVAISNSGVFGGGMKIVPNASLEDGLLDVVFIEGISKYRYLAAMPKVFFGHHLNVNGFKLVRGCEVKVEANRPITAYGDGDPIGELPLEAKVQPRALKILVPRRR